MAPNNNLCTCCLYRESVKDLYQDYTHLDKTENYCEMLKDCFGILLNTEDEIDSGICKICVNRLRHACDFKKQVQTCQDKLREKLKAECKIIKMELDSEDGAGRLVDFNISDIKIEPLDIDPDAFDIIDDVPDEVPEIVPPKKKLPSRHININRDAKKDKRIIVTCIPIKKAKLSLKGEIPIKKTKLTLKGDILKKDSSRKVMLKRVEAKTRYLRNFNKLVKYSNCTPFTNRSIHGFTCAFCDEVCKTIQELRDHVSTEHSNVILRKGSQKQKRLKVDITDLKCKLCQAGANSLNELKTHLKEHNIEMYDDTDLLPEFKFENDKEFKCVVCARNFETYFTLLKHMNVHYRNFVCDVCGTGFINVDRLKAHKRLHVIGVNPCRFCDKVFDTRVKLDNHEKYHKAPINIKCSHCNETFENYFRRNKHMKLVHNDLPANYTCKVCNKQFLMGYKLSSHIRKYHLMEKNHECSDCGKGFFKKQELARHMVKHTGERDFKCRFCGKSYGRKRTLVEHERIHTNDRRYKCPICGVAFVQKCSMKGHMLSNHSMSLAEYELRNGETHSDVDTRSVADE